MSTFRPPITAIRWGAVAVGLLLAGADLGDRGAVDLAGAAVLVAYASWRTYRPLALERNGSQTATAVEAGIHLAVVAVTGWWESPFVLSLVTAVLVVGFARGFAPALRVGLLSAAAVAIPYHLTASITAGSQATLTAQWTTELLLVAAVSGYARRFSIEVAERHSRDLDRLDRLAQANALLHSLHDVAQALPASLNLDEALDSVVARVRTFYDLTAIALLVPEETGSGWIVARQQGARLPARLDGNGLPQGLGDVLDAPSHGRRVDLGAGRGLAPTSRSGLYAPLCARDEVVGIIAVEHELPRRFTSRDVEVLDGFTEGAALAIDNARRFARLRRASADEERSRIAGELHDRVGQSLACLAFEIDLLVRHGADEELRPGLEGLGRELRAVIGDIRDTLSDLRSDVSEDRGMVETVEAFLDRVNQRSGHKALFHYGRCQRLPLHQERVMWRVLYDAVNQALRRGNCSVEVWWSCDGTSATLEVTTDVDGFDLNGDAPPDTTWVNGVRELAAGIGATLETEDPAEGTSRITCYLRAP